MWVSDSSQLRPQMITVEMWVYNPDTTLSKTLINKCHSGGGVSWRSYTLSFWSSASGYTFYINDGTSAVSVTSNFNGKIGWHHVAGIYDGSDLNIYVDGQLKKTNNIGAVTIDYTIGQSLYFGDFDGGAYQNPVTFDNVRIYAKALTSAQIQQHYAEGLPDHQNLAQK